MTASLLLESLISSLIVSGYLVLAWEAGIIAFGLILLAIVTGTIAAFIQRPTA